MADRDPEGADDADDDEIPVETGGDNSIWERPATLTIEGDLREVMVISALLHAGHMRLGMQARVAASANESRTLHSMSKMGNYLHEQLNAQVPLDDLEDSGGSTYRALDVTDLVDLAVDIEEETEADD